MSTQTHSIDAAGQAGTAIQQAPVKALPGRWKETGGLEDLVRLDQPAVTEGMVVVARASDDWRSRPELRWQTWPDLLIQTAD